MTNTPDETPDPNQAAEPVKETPDQGQNDPNVTGRRNDDLPTDATNEKSNDS